MSFQYTIKKCKISVDRKKYTKNEIKISGRDGHGYLMLVNYSNPQNSDSIIINLKKPSEQVKVKEYDGTNHVLRFNYDGRHRDNPENSPNKTLQFKMEFERPVDGSRVYLSLIGKSLTIKKGKKTHRAPGIITRKFKYKKYDWKGQKEKIKKRKLRIKTKNKGLKQIMKNISDKKILQVARNKPLIRSDAPDSEIIKEAKRDPRMYFTKEELLRYAKGGESKNLKRKKK
jgi:hypothetical protein